MAQRNPWLQHVAAYKSANPGLVGKELFRIAATTYRSSDTLREVNKRIAKKKKKQEKEEKKGKKIIKKFVESSEFDDMQKSHSEEQMKVISVHKAQKKSSKKNLETLRDLESAERKYESAARKVEKMIETAWKQFNDLRTKMNESNSEVPEYFEFSSENAKEYAKHTEFLLHLPAGSLKDEELQELCMRIAVRHDFQ